MIWLMIIVIYFLAVIVFILCMKICSLKKKIDKTIKAAQNDVANLIVDKTKYALRVKELEDGISTQFGIAVRNEITNVECIFTKLEMVIIMAGIYKLIEHSGNIDDKEAYIKLYKKTQENVEKMEEERDGD